MMPIHELRARHPMPWRYVTLPPNRVVVVDQANNEVPMFLMLDLVVQHTHDLSAPVPSPQAAPL